MGLAFGHGLRFDVAALLWLNLPLVLLSLLVPVASRQGQQVLRGLFVLANFPGFLMNIIDWQYFKFIGRRLSNEWHTVGGRHCGAGRADWRPLLVPGHSAAGPRLPAVVAVPHAYPPPTPAAPAGRWRWVQRSLEFMVTVVLVVLGLRGGWQLKPLRTGTAFEQQPAVLGHLAAEQHLHGA